MTLPLNSRLSALYDTNGTQKDFSFGFRVFFDPDNGGYGLEVRRQTADGYEVIPKSDYLVLPVEDNSAGVVRFSVAPSAGQQIYVAGKTPTIQQLVLTNFGRYSAESIETQFDFITAIIQEWLSALDEETRQRMAADDILTQYVVQRIDDFVQQVNQNFDDKSQEIEDYIATIMPSFTQTLRDEIEAYAVAGMQDAIEQTLAESKAEIDDAVARANAAAFAAAITGKLYDTPEAGVDPVTGVQNGAYYNVRSPDDDSYLVEYQNIGGVPTPSGKSYPSLVAVQNIAKYTALPFSGGKTYSLNERVQLENGDIVKSTVAGNTSNPNEDMAGWVNAEAEQLTFNTVVSTRVDDLESYIVYAEKYGASLNEAMAAINTEFVGKRVRIYVPSDFPVTATVNLEIDCDLDLSTLQVQNDIDVIFNPAVGWNGSATPCDVFCNSKSIRLGWDLKKNLGRISINKCRFIDVGDPVAQTSADWYCGFYVQNTGIEKLDLYEPTTLNSYVKPNGEVGDGAGSNRNIILEGTASAGATVSDINIYDMRAENLTLEEDSDAVAINLGASTVVGTKFNIDIYRGYIKNVQRRAIKIIGHNTGSTGIRIHGDIIAFGGGVSPHACIDISGTVTVEWNGGLSGGGWTQGLLVWNGAKLVGNFDYNMDMGKTNIINGTSVRSLVISGAGSLVDINSLKAVGGFELYRNELGSTIKIKTAEHTAYFQVATDIGDTEIDKLSVKFTDPGFNPTRANQLLAIGAGKHQYKHISVTSDVAIPIANFARLLDSSDVEVDKFEGVGVFTTSTFLLNGASNTKIRKAKPTTSPYLVSCVNGGVNLLLDQCKPGTTGLIANGSASPLTNVVEINTQTF